MILCEDTRTSLPLLNHYDIHTPLQSHHLFNEHETLNAVINRLKSGEDIALITDAGTPGISDPGFLLVRECIKENIDVECLPGATAFVPALIDSGFACEKFCFEGFLPRKNSERETFLATMAHETRTMVFFESPRRLAATLSAMVEVFGEERESAVCRELTKVHEEVYRGDLGRVRNYFSDEVRGEIVIVVSGYVCEKEAEVTPDLIEQVEELTTLGLRAKDAARFVAVHNAQRPKHLYEEFLRSKTP